MIEEKNNAKNVNFLSVVLTDANDRHIPQYKVLFLLDIKGNLMFLNIFHVFFESV